MRIIRLRVHNDCMQLQHIYYVIASEILAYLCHSVTSIASGREFFSCRIQILFDKHNRLFYTWMSHRMIDLWYSTAAQRPFLTKEVLAS